MRQHAVPDPDMQERGRHAEALGRDLDRHHAVGALDGIAGVQGAGGGDSVLLAHRMHAGIGPGLAGTSTQPLGIQPGGDLMVGMVLRQLAQALEDGGVGTDMLPQRWAAYLVPGAGPAAPDDGDLSAARRRVDRQDHLRDHQPQQALAVHLGGGGGGPEGGQVACQLPHGLLLGHIQRQQLGPPYHGVVLFQLLEGGERLIPTRLQGAGDQAVLRLDRIVLALRALHVVAGPLETQLPVPVERLPLLLQGGQSRQGGLERGRPDRLQEQDAGGAVEVDDREGSAS